MLFPGFLSTKAWKKAAWFCWKRGVANRTCPLCSHRSLKLPIWIWTGKRNLLMVPIICRSLFNSLIEYCLQELHILPPILQSFPGQTYSTGWTEVETEIQTLSPTGKVGSQGCSISSCTKPITGSETDHISITYPFLCDGQDSHIWEWECKTCVFVLLTSLW